MRKCLALGCVLLFLLQGCGPSKPQNTINPTSTAEAVSPEPSMGVTAIVSTVIPLETTERTPRPTFTPTFTITPFPSTPTPTLTACMQAGGRVEVYEITTVLLPNPLVYRIYLPPCYDEQPERSYPVLYLIHGKTYTDNQWDRLGAPEIADRLIAAGEAAPFIIVMPRDRNWLEPTEDKFGLAVVQSLIPWIDEHYRTIPDRAFRAIGGLSRGGAWAIHLGLSQPELFNAVGMHSGFVFYTDVQTLHLWLYNMPEGMAPRIYMDIASNDQPVITASSTWLEGVLTKYDIPHEWHLFIGEHEETYWQAHVEDYLRWYCMDWEK